MIGVASHELHFNARSSMWVRIRIIYEAVVEVRDSTSAARVENSFWIWWSSRVARYMFGMLAFSVLIDF